MKIFTWLFYFSLIGVIKGANILALFPLPYYSHTNAIKPVLKELAARGHNMTIVSPFPQKEKISNWTDIVINSSIYNSLIVDYDFNEVNNFYFHLLLWNFCEELQEIMYNDETFKQVIQNKNLTFDLLITEPFFCHESLVAFGHKLNVPIVGIYPLTPTAYPNYLIGNPIFTAGNPHFLTTFTNDMTLFQRTYNALLNIFELATGVLINLLKQEKLMNKYMVYEGAENRPPLIDMLKNVSIVLIDDHFSIGYNQAHQPKVISVGGLSLKHSGNLPADLQEYMDKASTGVIYFTFGSYLRMTSMKPETLNTIQSVFRKLDLNILMKWENDTMENKPPNVVIRKWFPQTSILAHPNCRLFITHGGVHGLFESAYYGIPVLGIPHFVDQKFNLAFAESKGFGYTLLRKNLTESNLLYAIQRVLNNKMYKKNAEKLSKIVQDRPQPVLDTAIYWIEYVLRHGDMSHLRSSDAGLHIYQILYIDVAIVLILSLIISSIIIFALIKLLVCSFTKHKDKSKKD